MIYMLHDELPPTFIPRMLLAMDETDRLELCSLTDRPRESLEHVVRRSTYIFGAIDENNCPLVLGGLVTTNYVAIVWMVAATRHLERQKKAFLKESRTEVARMLEINQHLVAFIDQRYCKSKRWMQWLGFKHKADDEMLGRRVHVMELCCG